MIRHEDIASDEGPVGRAVLAEKSEDCVGGGLSENWFPFK